jgi:hypothetical protein
MPMTGESSQSSAWADSGYGINIHRSEHRYVRGKDTVSTGR